MSDILDSVEVGSEIVVTLGLGEKVSEEDLSQAMQNYIDTEEELIAQSGENGRRVHLKVLSFLIIDDEIKITGEVVNITDIGDYH